MTTELTNETLQRRAPSIFAVEPWNRGKTKEDGKRAGVSNRYRFLPTITVLDAMRDSGFYPVSAQQSASRIEGKQGFTKHLIRFRHRDNDAGQDNGQDATTPEIVLINSHDAGASFRCMLGIFRFVCSNGIINGDIAQEFRARHTGTNETLINVLAGARSLIERAPGIMAKVDAWKSIELTPEQQQTFATQALEIYGSNLDLHPREVIRARRRADAPRLTEYTPELGHAGPRDLWRTFNVVQENLIKGGIRGRTGSGRRSSTRAVGSVDRNVKINRDLWNLALDTGLNISCN